MPFVITFRDLRKPDFNFRTVIAFLCILLILIVGAAQLLHTHSAGDEALNPGCSLCAVAHLSALTSPSHAGPVAAESVSPFHHVSAAPAPPRYFAPSLHVRPPPVLTAHA